MSSQNTSSKPSGKKNKPVEGTSRPPAMPGPTAQPSAGPSNTQPWPPSQQSSRHGQTSKQARSGSQHSSLRTTMPSKPALQQSSRPTEQPAPASQESTEQHEPKVQEFRCIAKGYGGTLTIDSKNLKRRPIGTHDCDDDVGIYFRVDSNRAFCARISVETGSRSKIVSEDEGKAIAEQVCQKMKKEAKDKKWVGTDEMFGKNFVLVCRKTMSDPLGKLIRSSGWYIIEGIGMWMLHWWVQEWSIALDARPLPSDWKVVLSSFPQRTESPSKSDMKYCEMSQRKQGLVRHSTRLKERVLREGGNGFVVDARSTSETMIFRPNEKYPVNDKSKELNTATKYVAVNEKLEAGQWLFAKVPAPMGPGRKH